MNEPPQNHSVPDAKQRLLLWGDATDVIVERRAASVKKFAAIGVIVIVGGALISWALPGKAPKAIAAGTPRARKRELVGAIAALAGRSAVRAALTGAAHVARTKFTPRARA